MEYATYLTTMAQVAGVMVGFANLANAISRPDMPAEELRINKMRIILATELGILVICMSLLPLFLSISKFSTAQVFMATSLIALVSNIAYTIFTPKRVKRWTGKQLPTGLTKIYYLVNISLMTCPLVLNLFGVFGIDNIPLVYCFVIFVLFVVLATLFCRLLYSVLPTTDI